MNILTLCNALVVVSSVCAVVFALGLALGYDLGRLHHD